ncbi:long-chain acyl-CoA synthetase [Nakamurella panacisegetis]|uniref:Acyl-CoA synthetase n=1 Tax=Nakamurella panacisegetis TaxID=1090615 RepID=A0A1H0INR6_9ACTN|nr:long-chain fatty acid--CoA ligase [Nakamurella panacisegetis]SDO33028.1 long-chain acyl-CoA synthetase [Nakamurella panacisegetis]
MASIDTRSTSFGHLFRDRVKATPDSEAYRHKSGSGWESQTWAQTRDQVYDIAAGLIDLGVTSEQRVAIASGTRLEWILADLAIACAGAATTTVYPSTTAEDVEYILADSGSVVVIAEDAGQAAKVTGAGLPDVAAIVLIDGEGDGHKVLSWSELAARGKALRAAEPGVVDARIDALTGENLATLIYTSGTTGRPKGVRLVHDNWTYEGKAVTELGILRPDDVQYLWLPLSHVFGKMLIAIQLQIGFATAVDGDLTKIVENLGEVRPTFMAGAPRIFEKVKARVTLTSQGAGGLKAKIFDWAFAVGLAASRQRQARTPLTRLHSLQLALADKLVFTKIRAVVGGRIRFFISGSAALSRDVAEWFDAAGLVILEGYGMTETSAATFVNLPDDARIGTVGPPLPGTEVIIASDGEILVRGPGIMRGYHNLPEATHEVLTVDGWLHTGDIGELVDGYLKITDRKKDLIKTSGGKYVAPQKIEGIFKAVCPYASQIIVHGDGRKFISAMITLDPDEILTWAAANGLEGRSVGELATEPKVRELIGGYIDELNSKLERWETVKKFVILDRDLTVEDGELTPSMKVRRKVVEKQHMGRLDELYTG